jgi:hypothetical protein
MFMDQYLLALLGHSHQHESMEADFLQLFPFNRPNHNHVAIYVPNAYSVLLYVSCSLLKICAFPPHPMPHPYP